MDRDERFSFANNWLPLRDREDLFTREQLQILFHAVVARESIIRISQRVLAVNFHTFYHEADVVGPAVLVEVYCEERKKKKKKKKKKEGSRSYPRREKEFHLRASTTRLYVCKWS